MLRHIWGTAPAGGPTESTVEELGKKLESGDTIIDGGNSFFKDDIRRAKMVAAKGIHYVDAGPRQARRHGRGRLPALRAGRLGPLRQDGPQRDRVRHHAGAR